MECMQHEYPNLVMYIYCSHLSTAKDLAGDASRRFNLNIKPTFLVVPLKKRDALDPSRYPRFTMVCQALASVVVAVEALTLMVPEVWIDTTGWAFPYPLVRLCGSRVVAYVHYPTISSDMLHRVQKREVAFNNSSRTASNSILSTIKLIYYTVFGWLYGFCGGFANVCMVNSSWTRSHIEDIWWLRGGKKPLLVYPPCDTEALQKLPLDRRLKTVSIVSVAQFRPEKNHEIQLQALAHARTKGASKIQDTVLRDAIQHTKLILVGGCRNASDYERVEMLKAKVIELGLDDSNCVEFRVNVSFEQLQTMLGNAIAGIHSMKDEHFGISVVEYMAAGAIPIAHNSAGPQGDIVKSEPVDGEMRQTGFLCETVEDYSNAIVQVLCMKAEERLKMAHAGRKRSNKFSQGKFQTAWLQSIRSEVVGLLAEDSKKKKHRM